MGTKKAGRKSRELQPQRGCSVICEGPTESLYMASIQGLLTIKPEPTICCEGMDYLIKNVKKGIMEGRDIIFCLIDKDRLLNKPKELQKYNKFKAKFNDNRFSNKIYNNQSSTYVKIIECHPCFEIWFYYYFKYTTAYLNSYANTDPLKPLLLKVLAGYDKPNKINGKGVDLHNYMTELGSSFNTALSNSAKSIIHKDEGYDSAFSEMKLMFDSILKDSVKMELQIYQNEYLKQQKALKEKTKYK